MVVLFTQNGVTRRGTFALTHYRDKSSEGTTENAVTANLTCMDRGFSPESGSQIQITTRPHSGRYRIDGFKNSEDGLFLILKLSYEGRTERAV